MPKVHCVPVVFQARLATFSPDGNRVAFDHEAPLAHLALLNRQVASSQALLHGARAGPITRIPEPATFAAGRIYLERDHVPRLPAGIHHVDDHARVSVHGG